LILFFLPSAQRGRKKDTLLKNYKSVFFAAEKRRQKKIQQPANTLKKFARKILSKPAFAFGTSSRKCARFAGAMRALRARARGERRALRAGGAGALCEEQKAFHAPLTGRAKKASFSEAFLIYFHFAGLPFCRGFPFASQAPR
jgi:hypothetical protein